MAGKVDYEKILSEKGVVAFVPSGNSMWPTLKGGKQSVVVKAKEKRLSYYDVALYVRADGVNVLHRVVEVKDDGYVMRGDSQDLLETVKEEQVIGVMAGFYRGQRYIDANDARYLNQVERWFRKKLLRKIRLKLFYTKQRIKNKIKKGKISK